MCIFQSFYYNILFLEFSFSSPLNKKQNPGHSLNLAPNKHNSPRNQKCNQHPNSKPNHSRCRLKISKQYHIDWIMYQINSKCTNRNICSDFSRYKSHSGNQKKNRKVCQYQRSCIIPYIIIYTMHI